MKSIPSKKTPILIVDDDDGLLLSIKATLVSAGMPEPAVVSDSRRVMELLRSRKFTLVLLDIIMPHLGGMELLQRIKEEFPDIECVMVTALDEVKTAVQAIKFGAFDYLVKPLNSEKLIITLDRALERYNFRHELSLFEKRQSFSDLKAPSAFKDFVAEDEIMAVVFHQVEAMAPTDYSVIISGESGTGKELLSRIIHSLSNRSSGPFLPVNMAAFNESLFDDEFFGHVRGAYTGALKEKKGFFEAAQGGTLFLDEITELESSLQGKFLRVIQERELYRLGTTEARDIDVRIIAATNQDINEAVAKGHFRADLFYRLNRCHIEIPPLRERKGDILKLARHFLKAHAARIGRDIVAISPDLGDCLLKYPFPGNVRELENIIAGAVLLEKGKVLGLSSVRDTIPLPGASQPNNENLPSLADLEKEHIFRVLTETEGNRTRAAKILGIGLRTLQRKLKRLDEP